MSKKIVVTGGCGGAGSYVVRELVKHGHEAPASMQVLIERGHAGLSALENLSQVVAEDQEVVRPLAELTPGPAAPHPGKIICVGLNYRHHAIEISGLGRLSNRLVS